MLSYLLMKRILFKSSLLKTFLEDLKISQPEPDYIARNSEVRGIRLLASVLKFFSTASAKDRLHHCC